MHPLWNKHTRTSVRLKGYDYSTPGRYFVTICTKDHEHLLGAINGGGMQLSEMGVIAETCWKEIPNHFVNVLLDPFVIMPNHIHGITELKDVHGRDVELPF